MVRLKIDRHRRLNKRLFPILPNLVHFSPQTIEIRVNYGLTVKILNWFEPKTDLSIEAWPSQKLATKNGKARLEGPRAWHHYQVERY
jgi:hypothetical protein